MQLLVVGFVMLTGIITLPSQKCLPRSYGDDRIVCVCSESHCDTQDPVKKIPRKYYWKYTSNEAGERFEKIMGHFSNNCYGNGNNSLIEVKSDIVYQKIIGFGGALTDSTGINIMSLKKSVRKKLMMSYFSEKGIEYNLIRIPMAGSDFSTHPYSYHDEEDITLSNFSLSEEDYKYKLPLLHIAKELTKNKIKILTSSWVAPKWMKSNGEYNIGTVKENMYQVWADYHLKFIEACEIENITIWAISSGNEPKTATLTTAKVPLIAWNSTEMIKWLRDYLGPTIKNSKHSDTKILVLDDMRFYLETYGEEFLKDDKLRNYTDGIATHGYYAGIHPPEPTNVVHIKYPEQFLLSVEYSKGSFSSDPVQIGLWDRAEAYASNIIQNINDWSTGWVDWNMALDLQGGPTYVSNFCDSPILVNATAQEFYKQPMFYAMGHFSKFVPPDSQRIYASSFSNDIPLSAFRKPDDGIAIVILNRLNVSAEAVVLDKDRGEILLKLTEHSITTIVYW